MRSLASTLVLLTLTSISMAAEAVVAHVEVLEVSRTRLKELGIDDGLKSMQPTPSTSGPWTFAVCEQGASLLGDLENWKSQNAVRILGAPTLMTISGRPASFLTGEETPATPPGKMNQGAPRKPGLEVEVLPKIEAAGTISADLLCRYTEPRPGPSVRAKSVTIPALDTREISTHCELKPGQTLVMRGLTQATHENARKQGLRLRRVPQSKSNEVELIVLLRLELSAAANPSESSQPARR